MNFGNRFKAVLSCHPRKQKYISGRIRHAIPEIRPDYQPSATRLRNSLTEDAVAAPTLPAFKTSLKVWQLLQ
jgi:hypothetical protein